MTYSNIKRQILHYIETFFNIPILTYFQANIEKIQVLELFLRTL